MRSKIILVISLIFTILIISCQEFENPLNSDDQINEINSLPKTASSGDIIQGQYIVVLKNDVSRVPEIANEMAKANAATLGHVYKYSLKGFSIKMSTQSVSKMAKDPNVKFIEPDRVITLAPPSSKPGKPKDDPPVSSGQITPWGISRIGGVGDGTGKTAWIIDSGIDLDNPDLNVDTDRSVTFVNSKSPDDDNGHGTHVAGTIAALNNNIDVVGVAAGATVVAVKVLDRRGSGTYSGVIAGVDYVAANANPGDVANMSLGGPKSDALDNAVVAASKSVKFSLAAGNETDNANNHSPARANGSNIYTVSAMAEGDKWASFSNYGNPPVDFAAPGVGIISLRRGGGTVSYSGTSMAAPHVAGILLLGAINSDGNVNGDPDGIPDPIAIH